MSNFETAQPYPEQVPTAAELFKRYLVNEKQHYLHQFETAYEFTSPSYDVDSREAQATQIVERMNLHELQPDAEQHIHSYQEARDAKRWWVYRGLYLRDLVAPYESMSKSNPEDVHTVHGLEPMYLDPQHKLKVLHKEQNHAQAALKMGDPLYTQLFSNMEKMRQYMQDEEQVFFPIATEREFALAILWGSMERALKSRNDDIEPVFYGVTDNTSQLYSFSLSKGEAEQDEAVENRILNVHRFNPEAFLRTSCTSVKLPDHQFIVEHKPPTQFDASGVEFCSSDIIRKVFSTMTAIAWASQFDNNLLNTA